MSVSTTCSARVRVAREREYYLQCERQSQSVPGIPEASVEEGQRVAVEALGPRFAEQCGHRARIKAALLPCALVPEKIGQ